MWNERPLVWFCVCWVGGSAAAAALGATGAALVGGAMLLLAVAAAVGGQATRGLAVACLFAFCAAAGERLWADAHNRTEMLELQAAAAQAGPDAAYAAAAEGVIVSAVEIDGDRVQFSMEAAAVHAEGYAPLEHASERLLVQLRLESQPEQDVAAAWHRGDRVKVTGELSPPARATNSGGFDYRRYLSSQRIHWLLQGSGAAAVQPAAAVPGNAAAAWLGRVDTARAWLGARFELLYPAEQAGYMMGLILGIREDLDPELFQLYSQLGLTHLLAISGLHVGVFLFILGSLLRLLRVPKERLLVMLIAAVPVYVLMTGASPSVLRAGMMAMLGLAAARMGKLKDGLHLLAVSAVVILLFDPFYLENVSFQLSFIVTLGLIKGVPAVRSLLPTGRKAKWLLDLVAVSVTAQLVSFPLSIYYFNQFHLFSLIANMVMVPIVSSIVIPLGSAVLVVSVVWLKGAVPLAYLSRQLNSWCFSAVEAMSQLCELQTIWRSPPPWWIGAWLLLLGLGFHWIRQWTTVSESTRLQQQTLLEATAPLNGTSESELSATDDFLRALAHQRKSLLYRLGAALLALLLLLGWAYEPDRFNRNALVSFIDVGQGDSALIRMPEGGYILIDGGGTLSFRKFGEEWRRRKDPFEVGKKVLAPLLKSRGVHAIDLVVISHLDSDHIRGLMAVIKQIPVKRVWWNGTMKEEEDAEELLRLIIDRGIPLYAASSGMSWQADAFTRLDVLWPTPSPYQEIPVEEEQNEQSVVLQLSMYHQRFLFTGDINAKTEESILAYLEEHPLVEDANQEPVSVMKVAHHGSRFSTGEAWLDYWRPLAAAISVGASNSYGHPNPDVLNRLQADGIKIWRTDQNGEIDFRIDASGAVAFRK
ncbi:DNA internalization-related competence protein ComEC/Rec2 [Paenibacillus sp. HB172176]|uniref:DNA internalization-related competence protein ComEC/Rec2 n=1 Tax=Paenibacillus sp. HB172176 TaxID=2493690 RepID=UPI00143BCA13|nr:DNA internalization-related competence protein ComEC/Rec2 [Paenibacillus sp. HB172176]